MDISHLAGGWSIVSEREISMTTYEMKDQVDELRLTRGWNTSLSEWGIPGKGEDIKKQVFLKEAGRAEYNIYAKISKVICTTKKYDFLQERLPEDELTFHRLTKALKSKEDDQPQPSDLKRPGTPCSHSKV